MSSTANGLLESQSASLTLAPEFGYVVLVVVLLFFLNVAQVARIGFLRGRHGVEYPRMSAPEHPDFECAQRAHANTHEQLPFALAYMVLGGIRHPVLAASFGALFLLGRVCYTLGYWTGRPNLRLPGSFIGTFLGLFPLIGVAVSAAAGMIGWW